MPELWGVNLMCIFRGDFVGSIPPIWSHVNEKAKIQIFEFPKILSRTFGRDPPCQYA